MWRRFVVYLEKCFQFSQPVSELRDTRQSPQISTASIFWSVLGMFALRLGSFNALEQDQRRPQRWQRLVDKRPPSADTVGYALSRFSLERLRALLQSVNRRAWRNKAIQGSPGESHRVVAFDGHELFWSEARCCDQCLERHVERQGQRVTQYYHRVVVAQWCGVTPPSVLDVELIQKGEGEVVAATRLLARVLQHYGRLVDVINADALYLEGPFLKQVVAAGKYFLVVLKEEALSLYQDVQGLKPLHAPLTIQEGQRRCQLWDFEALESFPTFGAPVRVVWSEEVERAVQIRGGKPQLHETSSTWAWVTNLPAAFFPAAQVRRWGHNRWDIETRGFNEMVNLWQMDHCFKHDPTAIEAVLLILFLAFVLTYLFYERNLKPAFRRHLSRLALARRFYEDLPLGPSDFLWKVPEASPG